jgi:hypothetical protein
VELDAFQQVIAATYGERDAARGIPATVAWLCEEVAELVDLVVTRSLAHQLGIGLDEAVDRYARGCPICGGTPCRCR